MKKFCNLFSIKTLFFVFTLSFISFGVNAQNKSILKVRETLKPSESLKSPDGKYDFLGSLILSETQSAFPQLEWSYSYEEAAVGKADYLKLDEKGSLVLYNTAGKIIWSSASDYPNVSEVRLENNGNLVIYDTNNEPIWVLKDPNTGKYPSGGNGFFLKYNGTVPDPSRR
jgi:hypothetical protein